MMAISEVTLQLPQVVLPQGLLWICLLARVVYVSPGRSDLPGSCVDWKSCITPAVDPCPNVCLTPRSTCKVHNYVPYCACRPGYSGNPFTGCYEQASTGSCPPNQTSYRRKIYRVEAFIKVNFYAAMLHCQHHGWRLASIQSKEENDLIKEEIRKKNIRNDQFWTSGMNYPLGHWVWMSTGEPLPEFQDWEPGEPNNAGDEHCLEFYEKDNNGYLWNDKNCMEQVYPICEYFV
uniref:C-type lectin domain-containing protein n=1 Tax=Homalodisca liturata TaxID=320908 RepID=A0A1B6HT68_9HEMI